jgi:hypothetical protein
VELDRAEPGIAVTQEVIKVTKKKMMFKNSVAGETTELLIWRTPNYKKYLREE